MAAPSRLAADNFTPATRTPWGGTRILSRYKAHLGIEATGVVGESWEISVEPSFPSVLESGEMLSDAIARNPEAWLGVEDARRYGQCPLLVKLLDADENLSVQVHPADDDDALAHDESGKPESWVVLDAEPGAGLYLGFREGVSREDVEACLRDGGPLDELMAFVPVSPGDAFVIESGTPHAIGAGITLLEPQHVTPGRRGLTYRYWDWNRRYDPSGKRHPQGKPRELHVTRSLEVTRWEAPRGDAFVETCRSAAISMSDGPVRRERVVDWRWFTVERWAGTGELTIDTDRLLALTCVAGHVSITTDAGDLALSKGQSGVVPAAAPRLVLVADDAIVFAIATTPRRKGRAR
jgi:mannose-6-phosphate isomerase